MPRPTVVVTRPAGQSRQLTEALQAAGLDVLSFPLLAIGPVADEAPLRAALARLDDFALIVFVSPNAIAYAHAALAEVQGREVAQWPTVVPMAVVGPASVAALHERGIAPPVYRLIAPAGAEAAASGPLDVTGNGGEDSGDGEGNGSANGQGAEIRYDSEALWQVLSSGADALPLDGREVLIVRGNGGRDWLYDQLRAAGARVEAVEAYQRTVPAPSAMQWQAVRDGLKPGAAPQAWLLSSSEAVRNLDTLARGNLSADEQIRLREVRCIAPHARIAEQAVALGFSQVGNATPGDAGLLEAFLRWAGTVAEPEPELVSAVVSGPVVAPVVAATPASTPTPASVPPTIPAPGAGAVVIAQSVVPPMAAAGSSAASSSPSARMHAPPSSTGPASVPETPTKVDYVKQDNTSPPMSGPPPYGAAAAPPASRAGGFNPWWLLVALLVLALGGGFWWLQQRVDHLTQELARRQQTNDALVQASQVLSKNTQDMVKELQGKVGGLEAHVDETRDKQEALEQVYQDLMRNRDDWEVAEIQQLLTNAGQQLQLTGNVQVALSALQSADMRLARSDKPQYNLLRRAIARDIARMKAVPDTDLTGAAIKLDEAINQIDTLPLLSSERMLERGEKLARPAAPPAAKANGKPAGKGAPAMESGNAFTRWFSDAWNTARNELLQVIRVRHVDDAEALLLTGDQGWFLRENVKLRLLNARLALLSRNEPVFRNDLAASQAMIGKYFDTTSRRVQGVQTLLKQAQANAVAVELPTMSESLGALRALKKE